MRAARESIAIVLALIAIGCGKPPERHAFTVGVHHVSTMTPVAWEVFNHGREILIRNGDHQVAMRDIGPVGPIGIRREVEAARELWRNGRDEDARWRLRTVPVPENLFATVAERRAFWDDWSAISNAGEHASFAEVDPAFTRLLACIATLPKRTLDQLADAWMLEQDRDRRLEVAERHHIAIDGRDVLIVDTWYKLTHGQRERAAFVLENGYLMTVRTDRGRFAVTESAFDLIVASLRFS